MQTFNIVVLGGSVGKTALVVRFIRDELFEGDDSTVEDQYERTFVLDGKPTSLEVLDTGSTGQFRHLTEGWIQSSHGFLLLFSLTQQQSLEQVDYFRKLILDIQGNDSAVPIVVAGTMLDLVTEREVRRNTIQSLATRWDVPFYETSAKHNQNVVNVFEDLVRRMRERYPQLSNSESSLPKSNTASLRIPCGCAIM